MVEIGTFHFESPHFGLLLHSKFKTRLYKADTDYWVPLCLKAHGWHYVRSVAMLCTGFSAASDARLLKTHISHSFLTILNYKTVCACRSSIVDIPPVPNQPKTFKFPQRSFGQKNPVKRSFQSSWFANRTWLHYNEANDLAYCHVCMLLTETES